MDIEYKIAKDGGFFAMNAATGQVEYAYPTSYFAERAKRRPVLAALAMLQNGDLAQALPGYARHNDILKQAMIEA